MTEIWTNWAREQRCAPARIEKPTSEDELATVVAHAAEQGQNVRAFGSGHSFTDIACTDGVLIDTSGLNRLIEADLASGSVTVEAGIKLHDLGPQLAAHQLSLENQGDIDHQALAGALATATHGTGRMFPNISARVTSLNLITADGTTRKITDGDELKAARVSLGALGVISQVTLEAVPLYTLHRHDRPLPLEQMLADLDEHVDTNDHFEFFVFPYADAAFARSTRRSDEEPVPTPKWKRAINERLLENVALSLVCRTGRAIPKLTPTLNRFMTSAVSEAHVQDRAYRVYATERNVRFTEMEYAIPRAHGKEAVTRVLELVERRQLPILFPLEVRFSAGDDAFLSTAHERETCYIAVHQFNGMGFETYFRAVEAIMNEYGGRPHWGKRHYQTADTLRDRYPEWDRFQAVRARLDPHGTFTNDYCRRVLSPSQTAPVPA
jgi:FAD-linked oxidoreductase